jgi:flagella basal body P-ring formation protein FlgA
MIPFLALALGACVPIDAPQEHIRAADFARALPAWEVVAPDLPMALAPAPGVQRVVRIPELRALAARWNVQPDSLREVCFVRPVAPVPPEQMVEAMRKQLPEARIDVIETSRLPAPAGPIQFPRSGLRGAYWFGYVAFGSGHRFTIWARVNVTIDVKRIVASADLNPGEPIDSTQLHIELRTSAWGVTAAMPLDSPDEIAGWIPRRHIPAGTVIERQWLEAPKIIHRGDPVKVDVLAGATMLHLDAIAAGAGALGDIIPVQNPDSKRQFRARVEAKGRVSVKGVQ